MILSYSDEITQNKNPTTNKRPDVECTSGMSRQVSLCSVLSWLSFIFTCRASASHPLPDMWRHDNISTLKYSLKENRKKDICTKTQIACS